MRANRLTTNIFARGVLITTLASLTVVAASEMSWAAKRSAPAGSCLVSHRRVVANGASCIASCNSLNWCTNMACVNGQLSQLPLPCHSPEACPATKC